MKEYEVTYLGTVYNRISVNARNLPAALEGTQKMLTGEGWNVKMISAEKVHDEPNPHSPTVVQA